MLGRILWILGGVAIFWFTWKWGLAMLRSASTAPPPPPPTGVLRRINVRYRCSVCGVELRMTMAPDEDPQPPRHCMEDMEFVAPVE